MNKDQITPDERIEDIRTSILQWYPFNANADILYIGEADAIFSFLSGQLGDRVSLSDGRVFPEEKYDYIVSIAYLERLEDPESIIECIRRHLKPNGIVLLGMNNRLGIRYFCGDKDPYTEQCFDGVDDYFKAYSNSSDRFVGRCYDQEQLKELLIEGGFADSKFYSVFSDLANASFLFADGYIPNEELSIRIFPSYNNPDTVFMEEERLYSGLLKNGLFHKLANAYLIECSIDGTHTDVLQITNSFDRGREEAMITIIHENDIVTKQAAFPEGEKNLERLLYNMNTLKERGVSVVEGRLENGVYSMPLIRTETGMVYLQRIYKTDPRLFLQRLDEFRDEILKSSECLEGVFEFPVPDNETENERVKRLKKKKETWEKEPMLLLKKGFVDMIPLNSFFIDGRFAFFDQEFCIENYPLKAILWRVIISTVSGIPQNERTLSEKDLFSRYGIDIEDSDRYQYINGIANRWLIELRKEKELSHYYDRVRRKTWTTNANRQRMNFSIDDYQRLFVDIFDMAENRKLILFGSGVYAKRFLSMYGQDYHVYAVIDNNEKRWGQKLYPLGHGGEADRAVSIQAPSFLESLHHGEYKIIICIKGYQAVMKQLDAMGIVEYSIFDPNKAYRRQRHPICMSSAEAFERSTVPTGGKKYHVGYIAGVFDLYHIGHLNMFRRAKEMCDYLVVGVVSDEGVLHNKRTEPFVPFDERIELVRSCRYVDEAVEIPYQYAGTEEAWKMHHFDVQFSGSDYVNDPDFAKYKNFLERHGATMEFFPYTESTSSTKLKGLIEKKLLC